MPAPRNSHGAAVIDGKLYVVGGAAKSGDLKLDTLVYDPATDRWHALPPLPTPRRDLSVVAVGKTLYAIGGFDNKTLKGAIEALDVSQFAPSAK